MVTGPNAADTIPFAGGGADSSVDQDFGPYKIVRLLGEGGMGTVYLAEQQEPIRRLVALKVIKLGMSTREVMARFDSERQALALMEHPHIARVFDAGASDRGRPYFVMEYVDGIPITEYCDRHRLNNRERMELFMAVCQAVHHAHQKGIIHRDIKPSNVLVAEQDGKAFPKVIDFGIAKAIDQRVMERVSFTELGSLVGTPEYMSPEYRYHHGCVLIGRAAVRAAGGGASVRREATAGGGAGGIAADHPRGRPAHAIGEGEQAGGYGRGSRAAAHESCVAASAAQRGSELDRDESAGEGASEAVCIGIGAGSGHPAPPGEPPGAGGAAEQAVPGAEVRAEAPVGGLGRHADRGFADRWGDLD
jgi:hypothetical protein